MKDLARAMIFSRKISAEEALQLVADSKRRIKNLECRYAFPDFPANTAASFCPMYLFPKRQLQILTPCFNRFLVLARLRIYFYQREISADHVAHAGA